MQGSQICQISSEGAVVDACYTLAGDKVATCSSTGAIQVWSCATAEPSWDLLHEEELPDQPSQLAWCHPEHGEVLAVGTASGAVHILQGPPPFSSSSSSSSSSGHAHNGWQQHSREGWGVAGKLHTGQGAVSALAFAPRQQGLALAVGCSSSPGAAAAPQLGGSLGSRSSVLVFEAAGVVGQQLQWTLLGKIQLPGEAGSCHCLCWREAAAGLPPLLAVGHSRGGGVWAYQQPSMQWKELCLLPVPPGGHQQQLQALHWAPALGQPRELLAASFGSTVALYSLSPTASLNDAGDGPQQQQLLGLQAELIAELAHPVPVWKLEFNFLGNTLGCSLDGVPELWFWMARMGEHEEWHVVSKIKGITDVKDQSADDHMLD
ncbi:hypothetical protein COO60DRAFT_1051381 [Scenedesmus sp. NREL 46B-D3]|nr:hypothetical protein COO60DRAFT_1051381 [Scenedesmus sp. NREL 46B-D3]